MNKNGLLGHLTHAHRLEQLADRIGSAENHANVAAANVPVGKEETPNFVLDDMVSSTFPEGYEHLTGAEQLLEDPKMSLHVLITFR